MSAPPWDPKQYERFQVERDRPARELLARLPDDFDPAEIWDLGCGAGRHAVALKRRYPTAVVHGLDSSADMLIQAREASADVDWREGDIATWTPVIAPDLIFTNAALHWLPNHLGLIPRLAGLLAPGGALAVQMPITQSPLHHRTLARIAADERWAACFGGISLGGRVLEPGSYYDVLSGVARSVDIWTTTYLHVLTGPDAVLEWMKGAALRPYLARLSGSELEPIFLETLASALGEAFPARADGTTLLPFPRLFLMARRP